MKLKPVSSWVGMKQKYCFASCYMDFREMRFFKGLGIRSLISPANRSFFESERDNCFVHSF